MKFIVCKHNKSEERPFEIYTLPDTALHINKRPFFIPDYAVPCLMHLHRAVRICRLGRHISARFAERYYDAFTLCARFEAPTLPPTVGRCFDECTSVGEWIAAEQAELSQQAESAEQAELALIRREATAAIAEVSQYFTLRQGDVILLSTVRDAEEVHIDQHIEETYLSTNVLQFNIK